MATLPALDIHGKNTPHQPVAFSSSSSPDEEKASVDFASPADSEEDLLAKYYEPPDSWENKHRWDPKATWTDEELKKLTRKLDWRVTLVACICFAALQLDRGNIGNALSDGMLADLHLTTNQYNYGQTLFYACFLAAELPSQLISKKLGSDVWIPIQMMSWSVVALSQVGLKNVHGFYATRALLGLLEGGFIADTILYLSYYYTASELSIRLGFFWVALTTTSIVGSFLAAGLLALRGTHGLEGWRWLFLVEGIITFFIGLWAYFYLPAGPTQTAGGIRGKGWFTEREEIIIVNKVIRDDPSKSDMHNRQGLTARLLFDSLWDFDLWPIYALGLTTYLAPATVNAYFSLTLKSLGFSTFQTNMLMIPQAVLFMVRLNERLLTATLGSWWQLIFLIVIATIPDDTGKWVKWALLSLLLSYFYQHPLLVGMVSANSGSVRTRTVASSVYNMAVQASSMIASNVYRADDKPYYHRGNRALIGIVAGNLVLFFLSKAYYVLRNRHREKIWNGMTTAEKESYLQNTTDKGNKRYVHLHLRRPKRE
ncbi:hypothetical protein QFC22_000025 [Naganishia vaughanmartiniae]|uniref:Uncharacterized protein n=1 Tax=Naganishia vaughanmartiniae TaxID=1424756 RepID=A0ACC2XQU8_9TREE|nr:hypothetical protein QFC22_000025 [Naganishia vaughanmartiniae]